EAMLFNAGAITRLGRVEDGTTTSDYDPDEQRRRMSVNLTLLPVEWKNCKVNLIDTPGYADFVGEVHETIRAVDGAIVLACAVNGVEVGTEQVWRFAQERELPRMAVINRMDRENANYLQTLEQLRERFGKCVVPVQLPIGSRDQFQGVVDLLARKAVLFG